MTELRFTIALALAVSALSSCATNSSDDELDLSLESELQLESLVDQPEVDALEPQLVAIDESDSLIPLEDIDELSVDELTPDTALEVSTDEQIEELLAAQALETNLLTEEDPVLTPISVSTEETPAPAPPTPAPVPAAIEEPLTPVPAPAATEENTDAVIVEVTETFYRLKLNTETNVYDRTQITEARPGNLIELVVLAQNKSDIVVRDVELNNTVPSGPVTLLPESIATDTNNSIYRISRNGETFFPADAELEPSDIRFIQWVIIALQPEESIELKYRFTVNR